MEKYTPNKFTLISVNLGVSEATKFYNLNQI